MKFYLLEIKVVVRVDRGLGKMVASSASAARTKIYGALSCFAALSLGVKDQAAVDEIVTYGFSRNIKIVHTDFFIFLRLLE